VIVVFNDKHRQLDEILGEALIVPASASDRILEAAQSIGILHRDVKPSNCFVSFEAGNEPIMKLLDFGVARSLRGDVGPALTQAGLLIGTPSHIAPELLRTKDPATPTSDIYSLGVVAYRLLSGRLPFFGDTMFSQMQAACFDDPDPLDDPDQDVPVELQQFVLRLLSKNPTQRPSDARSIAERFRLIAGQDAPSVLPLGITPRAELQAPMVANTVIAPPPAALHTPPPRLAPPPAPTQVGFTSEDTIEELDLDELLVAPRPWHTDRRLWLLAAMILGVFGLTVLVALSDEPRRLSPASEAASDMDTGSPMLGRLR
ncbi:MAG: protein kinase, partial [Nannocystaceae bacterium]|nr:protein kinase [Nannocystaceae bacterium]